MEEQKNLNDINITKEIAAMVAQNGGRTFYVGGYVRDKILGLENKDIDIEVHGITPEKLLEILRMIGEPISFGSSFGVYCLRGYRLDIAMPRKEHATGRGHKDFEIFVDPFIGTTEAARRRDFTMNAVMQDVLTGEFVDPFGGRKDIASKTIHHVDDGSFAEDPLRVFRAAQFASRLDFKISGETIELCRNIDVSYLSRERVEQEMKKALTRGIRPSVFFESLRKMNKLNPWFSELELLIGLEQNPKFHPEGDVWIHTMEVIDRASEYRDKTENSYLFMLLALTHDFGKIDTTEFINGCIHTYGHETAGIPRIKDFIGRLTDEAKVMDYLLNMVPLHMKPNIVAHSKPTMKSTNRMFDEATSPKDLIYFAMSDKPVFSGDEKFSGDSGFLFERYELYLSTMEKPYVTGKDLIEAGLSAGPEFKSVLDHAHKLRLAGIDKENALKQTLSYARKRK